MAVAVKAGTPGAPPPQTAVPGGMFDDFDKQMYNYQQVQGQAGYSPEQIAAMQSPWYSQHQTQIANAQAKPDPSGMFTQLPDPNRVANGIQYAAYVPGWNTSMSMADKYQDEVKNNSQGFNFQRSQALTPGPTQWATKERMRQNALAMDQRDSGAQQSASASAKARDALAAQGGLSSGARERVAEGEARNLMGMQQGINRSQSQNDLQVGATDETNKLAMLSNVVGQESDRNNKWMAAHQDDIAKNTAENERLNAYNRDLADQRNKAYAAQQSSNAQARSGK